MSSEHPDEREAPGPNRLRATESSTHSSRGNASISNVGKKRPNNSGSSSLAPPTKKGKNQLGKSEETIPKTKAKVSKVGKSATANSKSKMATKIAVLEAVDLPPASAATIADEAVVITPASPAGQVANNRGSGNIANATSSQLNTEQRAAPLAVDQAAACNIIIQALQAVFQNQNPGTLSARAEDTPGSRGNPTSTPYLSSLAPELTRALPVRAGDTTGPRNLAPCTVSRAPDSPVREVPPARAGEMRDADRVDSASTRHSRSRIRDTTTYRRRETVDIGARSHPTAASIHLTEKSDTEYNYHRPCIASRSHNWADDQGLSVNSSSVKSDSDNLGSVISTQNSAPLDTENRAAIKDGILAADLLIKYCPQLKAESTSADGTIDTKPIFCWDSELKPCGEKQKAVKLDTPYSACYNKLADNSRRLRAVRKDSQTGFRFDSGDYDKVFSTPRIPEAAFRVGDARARKANFNAMRSSSFRRADNEMIMIDKSARTSMRLAAYQSYLITALREADRLAIGDEDQKKISDLLLRISDMQFEQASRTALLCTKQRRTRVLEHLKLEKEADKVLHNLSLSGPDLFSGKLQSVLDENISASSTADKTVYKLTKSDRSPYQSTRGRQFHPRSFRDDGPSRSYAFQKHSLTQFPPLDTRRDGRREYSGKPFRKPRGQHTNPTKDGPMRGRSYNL